MNELTMPSDQTRPDDDVLLREAAAGGAAAFAELVGRYYSMVHTIAYGRTRQWETAEDLAQEVFLRTYLALGRVSIPSGFAGWLVRVTHNLATDWNRQGVRRSKLVKMVPLEELHLQIADEGGKDARTMIPLREDKRGVREAILRLPEAQRDIVLLHYTEGLSQREIAARLGVHPSTVHRQLRLAIRQMQVSMESLLHGTGPALRPPREAAMRTIAMIGVVAGLGAEAQAALVAAAGGTAGLAAMAAGSTAAASSSLQAGSLLPILGAGWRLIMSSRGLLTLAVVGVIAGAGVLLHKQADGQGTRSPAAASVVVTAPKDAASREAPATAAVSPTPPPQAHAMAAVATPATAQVPKGVLPFPEDRSLGQLLTEDIDYVQDPELFHHSLGPDGWGTWEYFGEARGRVGIPPRKRAMLLVGRDGIRDLSPLRDLPAGSIHRLAFSYEPWAGMETRTIATDDAMRHVAQLRGLRELNLEQGQVTARGMAHIGSMQSLEELTTPWPLDHEILEIVCSLPSLKRLYFSGKSRLNDAGLHLLARLPALEQLQISQLENFTDAGLAVLPQLRHVYYLSVYGKKAPGMKHVAAMPSLVTLLVGVGTPVDDGDVAELARSNSLRSLSLYKNTIISDAAMASLARSRSLKRLELGHTTIGDNGAAYLKELKQLEWLSMSNVTDRGVGYLAQLPNLKSLTMGAPHHVAPKGTEIHYTPEGLKTLKVLGNLEELSIGGNWIDDGAMDTVAGFTGLKKLSLFGCPISNAGLARLAPLTRLQEIYIFRGKQKGETYDSFPTVGGLAVLNNMPDLERINVGSVVHDGKTLDLSNLKKVERLTLLLPQDKGKIIQGQTWRDADLACMSGMTNMKDLQILPYGGLTDAGLAHLAALVKLDRLSLGGEGITDAGLRSVSGMRAINQLRLEGKFTDSGLSALDGLKNLRGLHLKTGGEISEAAAQGLRARLPQIETMDVGMSQRPPLVAGQAAARR